ncbi:hypothetical protein O5O45_00115 [Hahella aquimaris]|uniref:hypothetical protein n=1 Tax=Hahella sp. HNIBRBA332 TaxID=3015983 RepID=UPI00273AD72E|nr:hypothetical protein [Hahella sp. HNIBRBA332]WLQ14344.1 hypothetical protein O5O45_00115 [Hahella sp. HNIBRBA332]
MTNKNLDWDKYFANAKWNEICEKSPFFDMQRPPSLVHQEAGLVYLSSLDLDFSLSDGDALKSVITDVQSVLQRSLESKNYYKAAVASTDLAIISNLLSELGIQTSGLI